jgi:serine-type D-Ala-D-Ala carboxypeptidase/endopeptidase
MNSQEIGMRITIVLAGVFMCAAASVTREGPHLFAQLPGQPKFEVFAESERDYFLKVVDAQVTFETDSRGRATAVALHQLGRDLKGVRTP